MSHYGERDSYYGGPPQPPYDRPPYERPPYSNPPYDRPPQDSPAYNHPPYAPSHTHLTLPPPPHLSTAALPVPLPPYAHMYTHYITRP
ncbi:hypothetical protein CDV55_103430 [Aspergillus turcosus]|nr:hypothetical protein CDV55_103430 [Aspergillus turcosus]